MRPYKIILLFIMTACAYPGTNSLRIISLGPVITEELFNIGAGSEIVGVTTYCIHPEAAKKIERIGDLLTMNTEKMLRLRPDIVIATGLTHPGRVATLRKHGITSAHFPQAATYGEMCARLLSLGRITHHENEAVAVIASSKKRLSDIERAFKGRGKKRVLVEIGISPLFAVTTNSFINDIITYAGGVNVTATFGIGMMSRESAVALDPEVIIIADMGIAGGDEARRWRAHTSLAAVRSNAIHIIEPYGICSTTVASFPTAVASIAKLIHGGAK